MADRNAFLDSLRYPFFAFQALGKKLAARLNSQFDHSSIPAVIDDDDLDKLKDRVDRIRAALMSAEEQELSDASDRLWMRELRDLLHNAEDVLEEIEFESVQATRLEEFHVELAAIDSEKPPKRREEVSFLFYSSQRESISAKIDRIMEKFAEIASDRVALRLDKDDGLLWRSGISRVTSSSSLCMGKLHGREEELLRLGNLLLIGEDNRPHPYSLISLVGMPGIGKTAIVQHLCDDEAYKCLFKHRFWVSASQGFDSKEITKTMLNQFGEISGKDDLDSLQRDLRTRVTGDRLLLVLDDVWLGNRKDELPRLKDQWEILRALLSHAGEGSKVILTTQNNEIAKNMGSDHTVYISGLSDDHCWEICREQAPKAPLDSKPIIKYAINKCKGMPLAAKAVGRFLNSTPEEKWADTLQNLWCDDVLNEIISFLRICYDRLPRHLKFCFVYCSLFPKGYSFQKDHLVGLWLGQNFVELEPYRDQHLHLEECGGRCFDELVNRCLFQSVPDNELGAKSYIMHDLLHEFAQFIAFEEHLRIEGYQLPEKIGQRVRHSSLVPPYPDNGNLVNIELSREKYLRTLLFLGYMHDCKPYCINMPDNMFWLIRSLRALDLSNTNMKELPTSFNHLIHLRYLSLRKTNIETLPESICGLFKLQTLDLKHCKDLRELPQGIKHLNQLSHLELPKQILMIPFGIRKLVNLRKLPVFIIGYAPGTCRIEDLQDLKDLGEQLHIIGLNHVRDEEQAKRAFLKSKLKLRKLKLQWSSSGDESSNLNPNSVFTELQPGYNLRELAVRDYSGQKFPPWLGDLRFTQLVKVNLKGCRFCEKLPSLGQLPVLKHLTVQLLESVQSIGTEFCGRVCGETKPFPALETLEFRRMVILEEWTGVEEGDFPCLQNLILSECKELRILPQFNSVKTMSVRCCEKLNHYPQMPSLRCLNLEGFENMKNLPHLSNLATLEKLEVVNCKQLSGAMSIQCFISLQKLKVVNCPALCISADDRLPLTLKDVHIGVDCLMLGLWKPLGFEEVDRSNEGYRKLVKRNCTTGFSSLVTDHRTDCNKLLAVDATLRGTDHRSDHRKQ